MSNIIKWAIVSLVLGYFLNKFCEIFQSDFLDRFLNENLILLLVGVLTINTATIGIILLRLGELSGEYKVTFPGIVTAMKHSIWEQLALLAIAVVALILRGSDIIKENCPNALPWLEIVIIAVAVYAVVVVYDTANAAFKLNDEADKLIKKQAPPTSPSDPQ